MTSLGGPSITFDRLCGRASELVGTFRASGVGRGSIVALQLPNSIDFVASFLATLELGAALLPIDRDAKESEIAAILSHFDCRAFVWSADRRDPASEALVSMRDGAKGAVPSACLVKLTSGSTGAPRGVITSEENLIVDGENICSSMSISPHDMNLGAIPLSHSYGFSNLVVPLLIQGTSIALLNDYLPLSILEVANAKRCTVFPGIPMIFDHLSQLPESDGGFEHTRTFISAGAPLPAAVSSRFHDRFGLPIHSFYGCSETGGITYDREGGSVERGTVGAPLDGVAVELDEMTGRLRVRSGAVAAGYTTGDDESRFSPGGSYLTDDLAAFRGDELELRGRSGDLINTAGKKVNPREVEAVILRIAGVREVKVFGEAAGARGEVVAAAVVAEADVTREQIRAACREQLSSYKVPRIVKMLESLPRDERGKFRRSALSL